MDFVSALAGGMLAVLSIVVIILGLNTRFRNWLKKIFRELLLEVGLISYRRPDEEQEIQWPDGARNLQEALHNISNRLVDLERRA